MPFDMPKIDEKFVAAVKRMENRTMGGAQFFNRKTAQVERLADQGHDFEHQLREAGYIVIRTV